MTAAHHPAAGRRFAPGFLIGGAVAVAPSGSPHSGERRAPASSRPAARACTLRLPVRRRVGHRPGSEPPVGPSAEPPQTGTLRFANWLGYIDINEEDKSYPTLLKFEAETGIKVDYIEAVDSNEGFFTTHLSGPLNAGLPTEWDIVVVTDWMVARLVRLGWLETLNTANTPNFVANLLPLQGAALFDRTPAWRHRGNRA